MASDYDLTRDPLFYAVLVMLAVLTTAPPALLGLPTFLLIGQSLGLTALLALTLRTGRRSRAMPVISLWLVVQVMTMALLTWWSPTRLDQVAPGGFLYRKELLAWVYTGAALPSTLRTAPLAALGELAGTLLGGLVSGGLIGSWFLARLANQIGFGAGSLLRDTGFPLNGLLGLLPWSLLKLGGLTGLLVLVAEPLLTGRWSPALLLQQQRRLLWISLSLLAAGLLLELLLPGLWSQLFLVADPQVGLDLQAPG